jgi:hypothetical protein
MLSIFLLVMGSGEPGNLQGRTQIALWRYSQEYVQIMIPGKPRASGCRAYQHGLERESALSCQILYVGDYGGRGFCNSFLV